MTPDNALHSAPPLTSPPPSTATDSGPRRWWRTFILLSALVALVFGGVLRSHLATRLDGFTIDEAWHITAGISYVRTGDFRLNPEHPPLVKLWLGALIQANVFTLPPFRPLRDKPDERDFIDDAVYLQNDPDVLQQRARLAMFALHALLLIAFTAVAWCVFGPVMALAALTLLLIDPTVAAHLPVAMTDLPMALLSSIAMLLAVMAFRAWRPLELALLAVALGLVLGTKHSGVITLMAIGGFGGLMVVAQAVRRGCTRHLRHLGSLALVVCGAFIVLWSLYGFRFQESRMGVDQFNRPLSEKLNDLKSPFYRQALQLMTHYHLLPRAYIWGLADTVRAGMEGRSIPLYFFGTYYAPTTPWYFFPGVLLVKLPLGWLVVIGMGMIVALTRQYPRALALPLYGMMGLAALFLLFLVRSNAGYAGVRHALVVVPPLAVLGALALNAAMERPQRVLSGLTAVALTAALASALPVMRLWEYYNELVGGPEQAWRYFNDEGLDLRQRTTELIRYYDEHVRHTNDIIYDEYGVSQQERTRRRLNFWSWQDDPRDSDVMSGTVFIDAGKLAPDPRHDYASLRQAEPMARFGNLLVFQGDFYLPWLRATARLERATELLYSQNRDVVTAERLLAEAVALNPRARSAALELGNLRAARGASEEAIQAFAIARGNAAPDTKIMELIDGHIERLTRETSGQIPLLRNPWLE